MSDVGPVIPVARVRFNVIRALEVGVHYTLERKGAIQSHIFSFASQEPVFLSSVTLRKMQVPWGRHSAAWTAQASKAAQDVLEASSN